MVLGQPLFVNMAKAFNDAGVEYILVGGIAVIAHGHNRTTGDVDVWVDNNDENILHLKIALQVLGYDLEGIQSAMEAYSKGGKLTIYLDDESEIPVELMPLYSTKISFKEAWKSRIKFPFEGTEIHVVDLDTLIDMKIRAGREQDLRDVMVLKEKNNLK